MFIMMGGGGGGGGRGMRGFDVNRPHGSFFYNYNGSILDAKPFSLTGQPEDKAGYNRNNFGANIGGPLNIPQSWLATGDPKRSTLFPRSSTTQVLLGSSHGGASLVIR